VKDGVHERFLQGKLDIAQFLTTTVLFQQINYPANQTFYFEGVRRNHFVQLDNQGIG